MQLKSIQNWKVLKKEIRADLAIDFIHLPLQLLHFRIVRLEDREFLLVLPHQSGALLLQPEETAQEPLNPRRVMSGRSFAEAAE